MKFNWGTGIVISFILFMGFILYFVVLANTDARYDHDLVTEEYYKQELQYQNELNSSQRSLNDGMEVMVKEDDNGLLLTFPESLNPKEIKGKVSLYRPSDKRLDFEISLSLSNSYLLIPDSKLVDGRWDLTVDWQYEGRSYLSKQQLTYH